MSWLRTGLAGVTTGPPTWVSGWPIGPGGFSGGPERFRRRRPDPGIAIPVHARFSSRHRHRCWPARSSATERKRPRAGSGLAAAGQRAPDSPAPRAGSSSPPARRPDRPGRPDGRATDPRAWPSAAAPGFPGSPPAAPPRAGALTAARPIRLGGSATHPGSPPQSPGRSSGSPRIAPHGPCISGNHTGAPAGSGVVTTTFRSFPRPAAERITSGSRNDGGSGRG